MQNALGAEALNASGADNPIILRILAGIASASQSISTFTGRQFTQPATDETRLFAASHGWQWRQPGRHDYGEYIVSDYADRSVISSVATGRGRDAVADFDAVDESEWWLPPPRYESGLVYPSEAVRVDRNRMDEVLAVVGRPGWPAIPADIVQAAVRQASRWYLLDQAQFGAAGVQATELGTATVVPLDLDLADMIRNYRRTKRIA